MKIHSLTSVLCCEALLYAVVFSFLGLICTGTAKEAANRLRPGLLTWPLQHTEVKTGEIVDFTWRYTLTPEDMRGLHRIEFGLCVKNKMTEVLVTVTKIAVTDNSTTFEYNVTERYAKRLRWEGGTGIASFELANVTKEDSNSYLMIMSFESLRAPITEHVELIVKYPPKILNKTPDLKQVRLPEGESVYISCSVTSCPRALVTWYRDGNVIQNQTKKHDLTIKNGHVVDSGVYSCVARNELGKDKQQVLVIVTQCKQPKIKATAEENDKQVDEVSHADTLFTMIAPAAVFFIIFVLYFIFRCPAYRNRKKRNHAMLNSKATSTSTNGDEQTTSLLADWTDFSDRGEKV